MAALSLGAGVVSGVLLVALLWCQAKTGAPFWKIGNSATPFDRVSPYKLLAREHGEHKPIYSSLGACMHFVRTPPPLTMRFVCLFDNQDDIAKKIVDAALSADKSDGLGYMEASPFDVGVRGGWRKAGPPHRQRMLRLSAAEPGKTKAFASVLPCVGAPKNVFCEALAAGVQCVVRILLLSQNSV